MPKPTDELLATGILTTPAGDLAALFDRARAAATEALPYSHPSERAESWLVPTGYTLAHVGTEHLEDHPFRQHGTASLLTPDSLVTYLRRYATALTAVYVIPHRATGPALVAVLNDHGPTSYADVDELAALPDLPGVAGWRDHRAALELKLTPAWKRWAGASGKMLDQTTFAELIEDGITEIANPDGATLLEIAQTISASTDATFRSAHRLRDGQTQFSYVENVTTTAGATGELTIPQKLELVIAPFHGVAPRLITARLRYRITSGALTLGIILDQPEQYLADAVDEVAAHIREGVPASIPFMWAHAAPDAVQAAR